ncbi:hypothetical protein BDB01DRAFT_909411 [Pilobolus umbonatus]|nr:hypothetical protein BDB01DRAFT_909411 [Pilobolus umbonatus]
MATCSGDHYIFAVGIDEDKVITNIIHEKDETGKDNYNPLSKGTACIVNKNLEILHVGFSHAIMDSQHYKDVDDVSVFLIENIITKYYEALGKAEYDKNMEDVFILGVFTAYIEYSQNWYIDRVQIDKKELIHWVFIVPDKWNVEYFDTIKAQIISTNLRSIDNLVIKHSSYAVIRHLQSTQYDYSFVNGEFCIVIFFKPDNKVMLYGYEIGPPVKGLHHVAEHILKETHSIHVDYNIEDYLYDTIFNRDKDELAKYNITLKSIAELCHSKYWDYEISSLYKVVLIHKDGLLRSVKNSFLLEKKDILKSITPHTLLDNMTMSSYSYSLIKNKIDDMNRAYNKVRAILVSDVYCISQDIIQHLIDLLPCSMKKRNHNFNLTESVIITSGAAQIVQSQLKIDNHLPQLRNIETLETTARGSIMYIVINWNDISVIYINSNKEKTVIENTSTEVQNSYSLKNCFDVIQHQHQFHLSSISIKSNFKKMLKLDKQQRTAQKLTYSRKKKKFNAKTVKSSNINSVSDLYIKLQLRPIVDAPLSDISRLLQYKSHIPRHYQKKMLIMYIECLHVHIIQHLLSKGVLDKNDSFTTYFSIDQSILDTFLIDHEEVRTIFKETNTTRLSSHPMKLIHREQLSAVHCKETIKCYNRVEDYLDYPQYMMQVQLHPTYIDLTLNVILSLDKDITLPNNETVLTIKRKRIPFNIVDVMSELLWDYIQSREEFPIETCHEHLHSDYEMYTDYISHFNHWFTNEYTMVNSQGKSEWNKEIPMKMNTHCDCTLTITPMDILDICMVPAIKQIMSIIYGATTNTHIFGETRINHMILMGTIMNINCKTTHTKSLQLLRESVERQNKYYNHITLHWTNNQVSDMVYQGVELIKVNPLGGLLEQIISGDYGLQFSSDVYLDFHKSNMVDAYDHLNTIGGYTLVTEDMRENGLFSYYYYAGNVIKLILRYSHGDTSDSSVINDYTVTEVDSYPITVRCIISLREVVFAFSVGAEGKSSILHAKGDKFHIRENLILSPYV